MKLLIQLSPEGVTYDNEMGLWGGNTIHDHTIVVMGSKAHVKLKFTEMII